MKLTIQKLHPDAVVPKYATEGAACFDLHAIIENDVGADAILPGCSYTFRTGLAVEVPPGHVLQIHSRSGHGFKHGVRLANATGIIDSDYRGEILVCLINLGAEAFHVRRGDRIAQGIIAAAPQWTLVEADELDDTVRGAGGHGSTGV